jgi:hypothetical protein
MMKKVWLSMAVATLSGMMVLAPSVSAVLERSISPSRQFIIYGADVRLRGAMGDLAERTKGALLGILQRHDDWKTPIVLNLQFPQANLPDAPPSQLHISQTGIGLKLQLDLIIQAQVDKPAIQRDLLRAIFLEMIYRDHTDLPAGSSYTEAPPWLIDAVISRTAGEQKQTLRDVLVAAAESNQAVSLADFLGQQPDQLDSQARMLYRANAAALLQFLIDQPAGPSHLSAYIESLARASNDPLSDLKGQFSSLGGGESLETLWKSALAKFASSTRYEFLLSFAETERQLDQLLHVAIPNPKAGDLPLQLETIGQARPAAGQIAALKSLHQKLLLLSTSAHPLLRPVVLEYREIALTLASGRRTRVTKRLAATKAIHLQMLHRMTEMDDYMNWFEATQLRTTSGDFTTYLKAAGASEEIEKRRDALSVYLDAIEAQFQD